MLMIWSLTAIVLSIVWPRYGFFGGDALKATPFTLLATLSWVVLPAGLAFAPNLRVQIVREIRRRPLLISAIMIWYLWRLLSTLLGEDVGGSLTNLMRQIVYLLPLLFLGTVAFSGPGGRDRAVTTIVLCTAAVVAIAAAEMTTSKTVAQMMGARFAGDAQLLNLVSYSLTRSGSIRLQSVFYHPIVFAQYLAWAAPFLLHAATSRRSWLIRGVALVTLVVLPYFVFKTDARSGILALGVALAMYGGFLIVRRTGFVSFPAALALAVVLSLMLAVAQQGQSSISGLVAGRNAVETESSNVRSAMFQRGFNEIKSSPVFGYGDSRSAYHAGQRTRRGILTIDSAYLSALLDSGWVGLGIQLFAWLAAFFAAFKVAVRRNATDMDAAVAASLAAVFMVFAILSIMDNVSLIFISIALTATGVGVSGPGKRDSGRAVPRQGGSGQGGPGRRMPAGPRPPQPRAA